MKYLDLVGSMKNLVRPLCLIKAVLTVSLHAAPVLTGAEPRNWWVYHTLSSIQVLLTGAELHDASIIGPKGFQVEAWQTSANVYCLFAHVTISPTAKGGAYRSDVESSTGSTAFEFSLDTPLDPKGRFQGFSRDDVIYLIVPARFAKGDPSGDPSNDRLPELGRPADRTVFGATRGRDLRGIRDHLLHLKELGVTAVWMTPIYRNSLPGVSSYHGYSSSVDFFAVEPRFGTMQDLSCSGPGGQPQWSTPILRGRFADVMSQSGAHARTAGDTTRRMVSRHSSAFTGWRRYTGNSYESTRRGYQRREVYI